MNNKLNFEKITGEKTLVGGLANGEYTVLLTGFDVKEDSKGNPNYQFEFSLQDYEGIKKHFNTSILSMYKGAVSDIAKQLGFEEHNQASDSEVLKKATEETFSIWINRTDREYINFHAYEAPVDEDAVEF